MEKLFEVICELIKGIFKNRAGLYKKLKAMNRRQKIVAAVLSLMVLFILLAVLCYFGVFSPEITQVILSESSFQMYTGDTGALSATVLYSDNSVGDDVRWVSSNRAAVLIDEEGRLTAVARGESVITAQASNRKSAERAECIVTVADPLQGYVLSVRRTALDNYVYIDIQPHDTGVMEIKIYAKSPSGEIYSPTINENNLYHFYTETGSWTVYASLTGENGIYEAHRPEDFVQIEIEDVSAGYVDALLAGLPV